MPGTAVASLSDLLAGLTLSGQTWCYTDFGERGGFSVPPGEVVWFHAVLHGAIRATSSSGGTISLVAGDIALVLSGEAHALRLSADAPVQVLDFLREERPVDAPPVFPVGAAGAVGARVLSGRLAADLPSGASRQTLPGLQRLAGGEQAPWSALVQPDALAQAGIGPGSAALLTRLAALVVTAHLRAEPRLRSLFSPARQDPVAQALRLISGNPSASWTVERLARSVGMGRSNFAAHFTAQVGRAPMEVVAEQRMEQAADLLRKGNLKVAEISELCGYGSEAAFSRRFTRHFGISPSRMREAARAAPPAAEPGTQWLPLLAGRKASETAARVRRSQGGAGNPALGGVFLRGVLRRS